MTLPAWLIHASVVVTISATDMKWIWSIAVIKGGRLKVVMKGEDSMRAVEMNGKMTTKVLLPVVVVKEGH